MRRYGVVTRIFLVFDSFSPGFGLGSLRMDQGMLHQLMANTALVKELAAIAKDTALLHGIQLRIQESPNSSEVKTSEHSFMVASLRRVKAGMVPLRKLVGEDLEANLFCLLVQLTNKLEVISRSQQVSLTHQKIVLTWYL